LTNQGGTADNLKSVLGIRFFMLWTDFFIIYVFPVACPGKRAMAAGAARQAARKFIEKFIFKKGALKELISESLRF
jgi:hypothetical protein